MSTDQSPIRTYAEFWPFYLGQHRQRRTRLIHVAGTSLGLLALVTAILSFSGFWLLMALVIGYGAAWVAHAFVEHNRPATFSYPLWSLRGDFHMLWFWLTGRLESELVRYNIISLGFLLTLLTLCLFVLIQYCSQVQSSTGLRCRSMP